MWMVWLTATAACAVSAGAASADDGPTPIVFALQDSAGKAAGTETLRVVKKADGAVYASGEVKLGPKGKKRVVRTFIQRNGDGTVTKYQRTEGGSRGSGFRIFEYEGKMRSAPINGAGKPVEIAEEIRGAIWDPNLWHLFGIWSWPKECSQGVQLAVFRADERTKLTVTLDCEGPRTVLDADKAQVPVQIWSVKGLGGDPLSVFVAKGGKFVGAKDDKRQMLLNKWGWDKPVTADEDAEGDVDEEEAEIKDRGAGP